LVDASVQFVVLSALQVPLRLGTAMGEPARRRRLPGRTPFGPFPLGAKIDDGGHSGKLNETGWLEDRADQAGAGPVRRPALRGYGMFGS
jgi:hypothetical protein